MELAVLRGLPLGVWIVILPGPFDCVAHGFHDCYALDGLYIEGVFRDSSLVPLNGWAFIGSHGWPVEWMTVVICGSATWRSKVWLRRVRRRSPIRTLEWTLGTFVLRA